MCSRSSAAETSRGLTPVPCSYPLIIKLGHIQQSRAIRIFRDKAKAIKSTNDISSWVEKWFPERFDDATRSWAQDINVLYNALKPCVLVHPVLTGDWIAITGAPYELKVEVVWGRAYLGFLETRMCARKFMGFWMEPQSGLVATRDGRIMRFVEWPRRFEWEWMFPWDQVRVIDRFAPVQPFVNADSLLIRAARQVGQYMANVPHEDPRDPLLQEYAFLRSGKILERVFATAEAVAHRLGAEQVRVDIFVSRDPAKMPIVNEISLSSGHYYRYHTKFLAMEWAEGHYLKNSKHYDGPLPVPLKMLGSEYAQAAAKVVKS